MYDIPTTVRLYVHKMFQLIPLPHILIFFVKLIYPLIKKENLALNEVSMQSPLPFLFLFLRLTALSPYIFPPNQRL
jgi:hypothetical protein